MEGNSASFFQRCKPYIAMISLQFGFAGMNIITKVSLNRGMSHYVLVVYRHAFATAAIAPFAIVLERYSSFILNGQIVTKFELFSYHIFFLVIGRKIRPKISFLMFMQMFVLGLLGLVLFSLYKLVFLTHSNFLQSKFSSHFSLFKSLDRYLLAYKRTLTN